MFYGSRTLYAARLQAVLAGGLPHLALSGLFFRRVREKLRHLGESAGSLATLQYVEAAQRAGEDHAYIEAVVAEWIHQRPLKYLRLCRRPGLEAFLTFLKSNGIQVGVFSDYPVLDKLQALGFTGMMSLILAHSALALSRLRLLCETP
jgi:hypothetical protein